MSNEKGRPLVVGIGEVLWDLLPAGKQLGGAPANFAYHAAALGAAAAVVSRVGNDDLGAAILARLDSLGLDRRHVGVDPLHPTSTVDVRLGPGGVPDYVIHDGVAWDFLSLTSDLSELALRADAVCFGTLGQRGPASRRAIGKFLEMLRPQCLRVFDINLRQNFYERALIHDMLMRSDVLKLNDAELPIVTNMFGILGQGPDAVLNLMSRYPLKLVALTHGPAGSRLQGIGESSSHPGFAVEVPATADTVGAGDAFTAALVVGLLRGLPLGQINAAANRLAGYVCSQHGATPPIPAEFREALATNEPAVPEAGH
jgi:fructokinase